MTPIEWLLGDDTGISSKTILSVMTGSKIARSGYPRDTADFGRCYRLLEQFPEWRERMSEVAESYPSWRPMIEAWGNLTSLYESENGTEFCVLLGSLIDDGLIADGWVKTSPGCWQKLDTRGGK